MTTRNADIRLELFDGERWFPMEFPRDEAITYEGTCARARLHVEHGAARSVRVQLWRNGEWVTVKTITMTIVETTEPTLRCTCGHQHDRHAVGDVCLIKNCPCLKFELRDRRRPPSAVCACGHMRCLHVFGEGMCNRRHCSCLGFKVKEV